MSYCSHCGSNNVRVEQSPNPGMDMWVAESDKHCTECYDPNIEMLQCNDCGEVTYKSV